MSYTSSNLFFFCEDAEFGTIQVKINTRAKRISFLAATPPDKGLIIVSPLGVSRHVLEDALQQSRESIRQFLKRNKEKIEATMTSVIDPYFEIDTDCLHLTVVQGSDDKLHIEQKGMEAYLPPEADLVTVTRRVEIQIGLPCNFDPNSKQQQVWIIQEIEKQIRRHTENYFRKYVFLLARKKNVTLHEIHATTGHTRWGSCGRHVINGLEPSFNINISLYSFLLPLPLQRLIVYHELAHTHYFNHTTAFHQLVDSWVGGQEQALERQLKAYHTDLFSFAKKPAEKQ